MGNFLSGLIVQVGQRLRGDRLRRSAEPKSPQMERWTYDGFSGGQHWVKSTTTGKRMAGKPSTNGALVLGESVRFVGGTIDQMPHREPTEVVLPASTPMGKVIAVSLDGLTVPTPSLSRVGGHVPKPLAAAVDGDRLYASKTGKDKRSWVLGSTTQQVWWDKTDKEFKAVTFPNNYWERVWKGNGFWFSKPSLVTRNSQSSSVTETSSSKRTLDLSERQAFVPAIELPVASIELIFLGDRWVFPGSFYQRDEVESLETWDYEAGIYVGFPPPCGAPSLKPYVPEPDLIRTSVYDGRRIVDAFASTVMGLVAYLRSTGINCTGYRFRNEPGQPLRTTAYDGPSSGPPGAKWTDTWDGWLDLVEFVTDPLPPPLPPPEPAPPQPACSAPPSNPTAPPGTAERRALRVTWTYEYRLNIPDVFLKPSGLLKRNWKWEETSNRRTQDGAEVYNNKTYDIDVWLPVVADKTGEAVIVVNLKKSGTETASLEEKWYWSPSGNTLVELDAAIFRPVLVDALEIRDQGRLFWTPKPVPDLIVPTTGDPYLARVVRPEGDKIPTEKNQLVLMEEWLIPSGTKTTKKEKVYALKIPEESKIDWYSFHP